MRAALFPERRSPPARGHIQVARCTASPGPRAATRETSVFFSFLQAAQRTVLGGVDGGGATTLERVEEGPRQELVPEPDQVLERRPALLGLHDLGQPPAPRLELQQLLDDPLR